MMPRYALIRNGAIAELRRYDVQPADIPHKLVVWKPCPEVSPPSYDPTLEALTGPTYTIQASQVLEEWGKRNLTAPEIDAAKDFAILSIGRDSYQTFLKTIAAVLNEGRTLDRTKINAVITAAGISATVPAFTSGQTSSLNASQVNTYIKNNL